MVKEVPQHPLCNACRLSRIIGLGCSAFARRYLRNHCCFIFVRLLRCFSSPAALYSPYVFRRECWVVTPSGLPHSEILGSKLDCSSPRRIVAYHVLHRPSAPRHPPRALCSLISTSLFCIEVGVSKHSHLKMVSRPIRDHYISRPCGPDRQSHHTPLPCGSGSISTTRLQTHT